MCTARLARCPLGRRQQRKTTLLSRCERSKEDAVNARAPAVPCALALANLFRVRRRVFARRHLVDHPRMQLGDSSALSIALSIAADYGRRFSLMPHAATTTSRAADITGSESEIDAGPLPLSTGTTTSRQRSQSRNGPDTASPRGRRRRGRSKRRTGAARRRARQHVLGQRLERRVVRRGLGGRVGRAAHHTVQPAQLSRKSFDALHASPGRCRPSPPPRGSRTRASSSRPTLARCPSISYRAARNAEREFSTSLIAASAAASTPARTGGATAAYPRDLHARRRRSRGHEIARARVALPVLVVNAERDTNEPPSATRGGARARPTASEIASATAVKLAVKSLTLLARQL